MNYLVIKDNIIKQICTSTEELLEYLEVNITDKGIVKIGNENMQLPTSYNMKEFTKDKAMWDIKNHQLKMIEVILQIGIFKLERI